MKRKLLTVLLMSAMVLAGSTVAKADDVFDSNTEESSQIDMNMERQSEVNPEDTIGNLDEIADEVSDKERNTEDFITTYADGIAIDEVHFPDENFRKYLKDNFDENGDGYFSQDEIDSITFMTISNGVKSLDGINYFTSMTSLDCSNNQLTSLDVSKNPNLTTLKCFGNRLTALDVSKNLNLLSLDCFTNQLTELDVSKNLNLRYLNCGGNKLESFDVSQNTNLGSLICHGNVGNPLTELDVSKNLNLVYLDCSYNKLKSLDVSQNPNLRKLYCSNNQITILDVSQNPKLYTLDCNNNQITVLDVSKNPDLDCLYCMNNQIITLDVSKKMNLRYLDCSDNQLSKLNIDQNPNLSSLYCSNNQITVLNIGESPKLVTLRCNNSQIAALDVSQSPNLSELNCMDNQIAELDISKNPNLSELNCVNNQIKVLGVSQNPNLSTLKCDGNHLTHLDLSYNKSMSVRRSVTMGQGDGTYSDMVIVLYGAYVTPQNITANIVSQNGKWTLDLAEIVGKENLDRVTLATNGAQMSADGIVTFSGSIPAKLVYNYNTKNPTEDTPMTVNVALTKKVIDDQTGNDITVDTDNLDLDSIYKENGLNPDSDDIKIVLSQDNPSKENIEKLLQAVGVDGYSVASTCEFLMSLYSNGQKITDINDKFGNLSLTFQLNPSFSGKDVVVYQLHNNIEVIVHDGLTVNTDGTVEISVDKLSTFAVAVKPSSNNTGKPGADQSGTKKPDSNRPDTNKPDSNRPDTSQPDSNQPNTNQSNGSQLDVKQTNTNQLSPKTGDSTNPLFWLLVAMAASITGILNRKRFYKH